MPLVACGSGNAPTSVAIESVQTLPDLGFRAKQIHMGIPTYGRPMMGEAYRYDYRRYYSKPDENGLAGVMTFAAHCDLPASNEMSLHNTVARACADKLSDAQ